MSEDVTRKRKPLSGWHLGFWDCVIVLAFSFAPLLFTLALLAIFAPATTADGAEAGALQSIANYFSEGHLLFVALAVAGSVAAKIWLDAQYRQYSNMAFNAPIVACAVFAALIQSGRHFLREPDLFWISLLSIVLLGGVLWSYAWLIANGPHTKALSVEQSLAEGSNTLAAEVRELRSGEPK